MTSETENHNKLRRFVSHYLHILTRDGAGTASLATMLARHQGSVATRPSRRARGRLNAPLEYICNICFRRVNSGSNLDENILW